MLTMRAAAALLSSAHSLDGIAALLRGAGLTSDDVELSGAERDALGLDGLDACKLAAGAGVIRALISRGEGDTIRDDVQRLARRLASRAPHVLWIVAVAGKSESRSAIAVWSLGVGAVQRVASFVWEPGCVMDSDAETLCALAAIQSDQDAIIHARCVEVLGRDALTRRFFRALDGQVAALASSLPGVVSATDARELALLHATRLLFLHFLQAKGWMNGERAFLADRFDACAASGGRYHDRVLLPLFFGTLNTPVSRRARVARAFGRVPFLNGGLFTRTAVERRLGRRRFPDERFGALFDELFLRFRFVAREDTATWSEASVDPEMLGRAFESLMAAGERRAGGVYYTPHELVARVTGFALSEVTGHVDPTALRALRIMDPACGSGAFLVVALERLADLRRDAGDRGSLADLRRDVLARSIFGVDRSPTAVWLCQLRLWLSVVIESDEDDPSRVAPLPNLDRNVRVGDALMGAAFSSVPAAVSGGARMASLRMRYARSTGRRKATLGRTLDREERRRVLAALDREIVTAVRTRRDLLAVERARDLFGQRRPSSAESRRERRRVRHRLRALRADRGAVADGGALPLAFGAFFSDAQCSGGFDVVVGNPPWVRLHNIPAALRLRLRETYSVFSAACWSAGATSARAPKGFASQVDLASLFVERSVAIARERGDHDCRARPPIVARMARATRCPGVRRIRGSAMAAVARRRSGGVQSVARVRSHAVGGAKRASTRRKVGLQRCVHRARR